MSPLSEIEKARVSLEYGALRYRSDGTSWWKAGLHPGLDFTTTGSEAIQSCCYGTVYKTNYDPSGWGYYAAVFDGSRYWIYAHLARVEVKADQRIKTGNLIGYMGATGKATGKHLHLEIRSRWGDYSSHQNIAEELRVRNTPGPLVFI